MALGQQMDTHVYFYHSKPKITLDIHVNLSKALTKRNKNSLEYNYLFAFIYEMSINIKKELLMKFFGFFFSFFIKIYSEILYGFKQILQFFLAHTCTSADSGS